MSLMRCVVTVLRDVLAASLSLNCQIDKGPSAKPPMLSLIAPFSLQANGLDQDPHLIPAGKKKLDLFGSRKEPWQL